LGGRSILPAFALTMALVAAACGGATDTSGVVTLSSADPAAPSAVPSSGPVDFQQAMLDYTQCLRDNGIDAADPQFGADGRPAFGGGGGSGGGQFGDIDRNSPEFQAAQDACSGLMVGVQRNRDPVAQAERQAQLLVFAQCLRDEGVDFPDPQLGTGGGPGFGGGRFGDLDLQSPEVQAAMEVCQAETGGFLRGAPASSPETQP
ncbi:MAG: hypothetical protein V2B17_07185, partial [Chloroflexota bacterium]